MKSKYTGSNSKAKRERMANSIDSNISAIFALTYSHLHSQRRQCPGMPRETWHLLCYKIKNYLARLCWPNENKKKKIKRTREKKNGHWISPIDRRRLLQYFHWSLVGHINLCKQSCLETEEGNLFLPISLFLFFLLFVFFSDGEHFSSFSLSVVPHWFNSFRRCSLCARKIRTNQMKPYIYLSVHLRRSFYVVFTQSIRPGVPFNWRKSNVVLSPKVPFYFISTVSVELGASKSPTERNFPLLAKRSLAPTSTFALRYTSWPQLRYLVCCGQFVFFATWCSQFHPRKPCSVLGIT